ncbi:MAG: S-methyl-5-thioribose-1-phosphate isomerase [Candidatus Accumulibacter sp.]|jgi:methylthioribose-1-phosphate isomerase|nr:S-methyl-5-thioribose-1-phosphate isomerase [Accumulibacter sp.]
MNSNDEIFPVIRPTPDGAVKIVDQTALPHACGIARLACLDDAVRAIRDMRVRGAPLIGVTAAYGLALALAAKDDDDALSSAVAALAATRPTAVNLAWALERMRAKLSLLPPGSRAAAAWREAAAIAGEDAEQCRRIGEHGLTLLSSLAKGPGRRLEVMTHCNAGRLATAGFGTALAPIYAAFDAGIETHVWVSETRPRNQGLLTAWELKQRGVPHTLIADNAAGALLARGRVDAVIVGADRIAANGDVANKIGTCLKALAAREAGVPFYVAAPASTIDFSCPDGDAIPIEERDGEELRVVRGVDAAGRPAAVRVIPADEAVANPAFDVTPHRLIDAIVSERGHCPATAAGLRRLYPEERNV